MAGRRHDPCRALLGARRGGPSGSCRSDCRSSAVLEESVAAHLVADVPVASFLSGGWTRASSRRSPRAANPPSRPTRSPSVRRTSGWRRCPTTLSTPARWRRTWGSGCTRSRSALTWWTCCRESSTCSTSPSAIPLPSTRFSCARPRARPVSRSCCREWARTSCSAATASTWRAFSSEVPDAPKSLRSHGLR